MIKMFEKSQCSGRIDSFKVLRQLRMNWAILPKGEETTFGYHSRGYT